MSGFTSILVHLDFQADSHPALDCAVDLAKRDDARLTIVDVIPEFPWTTRLMLGRYEQVLEAITQSKTHWLQELAASIENQGVNVATRVVDAPTSVGIIREVLRENHDLVIKAAKGRASRRTGFFGTTATRLLRKCPCPVLILNRDGGSQCEKVVAAVNATPDDELHDKLNSRILELARAMSVDKQPEVISAWGIYGESILKEHMQDEEFQACEDRTRAQAEQQLDALVKPFSLAGENLQLLHGDPGDMIPQFIRDRHADLLVMGTIGRSGIAGLLIGNTAEQILDRVQCSVLAIKPEGFVSPIKPNAITKDDTP